MEIVDTTSMDLAREAVRRGIALLDEHGPEGWRERIDVSTLDMKDGDLCVWGQIFRPEWIKAGKPHFQPFGYGRSFLAGKLGIVPNTYTDRWVTMPEEYGVIDFREIDEDCDHEDCDDECVTYVTSEHLADAWTESLSC